MKRHIFCLMILMMFHTVIYAASALDKVVAVVNDEVITSSELKTEVDKIKTQIMASNTAMPPEKMISKQVLNRLIDTNLQMQLANRNHVEVDGIELNDAIKSIAQKNELSLGQLKKEITNHGMDWAGYRENIRKEMILAQVQQRAVSKEVVISSQMIDDYLKTWKKQKNQQLTYHLKNLLISVPESPTTEQVKFAQQKAQNIAKLIAQGESFESIVATQGSDTHLIETNDLGDRHLAELPEVFAQKVVEMKAGETSPIIKTDNGYQFLKLEAIKGESEAHQVTKAHVRHILFNGVGKSDDALKKQADNVYQQLKSGLSFANFAKKYSQDSATREKGGDLGWVSEQEVVPEFANALKTLPLKQISKPVHTKFGWHILQVLERKQIDDSKAFERQQVQHYLERKKFEEAVQQWKQQLRTDAFVKIVDKALA